MLGWIPIIGPIIDGIFASFNKYQDVGLKKYQEDAQTKREGSKDAVRILETFKDDIGVRLARDIVIFPVAIWSALIGWDTIVAKRFPEIMWHVEKYPESVAYLPGAVLLFLLGNVGINAFLKR